LLSPSSPPSVLFTISFFLHRSRLYLYLHSFPTRRSSDLVASRTTSTGRNRVAAPSQSMPPTSRPRCSRESAFASSMANADSLERSEEHTSELQSPDHLVCRLLLEKKKNNKINDKTP